MLRLEQVHALGRACVPIVSICTATPGPLVSRALTGTSRARDLADPRRLPIDSPRVSGLPSRRPVPSAVQSASGRHDHGQLMRPTSAAKAPVGTAELSVTRHRPEPSTRRSSARSRPVCGPPQPTACASPRVKTEGAVQRSDAGGEWRHARHVPSNSSASASGRRSSRPSGSQLGRSMPSSGAVARRGQRDCPSGNGMHRPQRSQSWPLG
jgi:hypothetical protein